MPVYVTFHDRVMQKDNFGFAMPVLGSALAARSTLAVSAGEANSTAAPRDCIAVLQATELCCFAVGASGAVEAAQSEPMMAGAVREIPIKAGEFVSVAALA